MIKVLPTAVAADAEQLARFQREAEALAALNHPNIAGQQIVACNSYPFGGWKPPISRARSRAKPIGVASSR